MENCQGLVKQREKPEGVIFFPATIIIIIE